MEGIGRDELSESADEALWARVIDDDGEAFGLVFDRHAQAVFGHSRRLSQGLHDAEDITSLVFLEAWRKRSRVRFVRGSLRPWLLVTATNIARNSARSRRRYAAAIRRLPYDQTTPDIADDVVETSAALQQASRLHAAMLALRREEREAITACDLAGVSPKEAAALLKVPVSTLKSRLHRGRSRLRRLCAEDDITEHLAPDPPQRDAARSVYLQGGT